MREKNSDKSVVISVLSGKSEAYGDIIHKYKNIVFKSVYNIVKNYHTAEDLTQETFIDGYVKLKSLGEPYNAGAWLVKIAELLKIPVGRVSRRLLLVYYFSTLLYLSPLFPIFQGGCPPLGAWKALKNLRFYKTFPHPNSPPHPQGHHMTSIAAKK